MKIILLAFVILLTSCFEDNDSINTRFKYYKKINQFSNNVEVKFDKKKGLYSVAKRNIDYGEKLSEIPKSLTMCPFYLFPFKFEIIEALKSIDSFKHTLGMDQRLSTYVLTYYVLYFIYAPKDKIRQYIIDNKIEEYNNIDEIDPNMADSFPNYLLSQDNMEQEHFNLINNLGYGKVEANELGNIFTQMMNLLSKSPHFHMIYPWASNYEKLVYSHSIVTSRSLSINFEDYMTLDNIKNRTLTRGEELNLEYSKNYFKAAGAPCILNFMDIYNHYQPKHLDMRDIRPVSISVTKGMISNVNPSPIAYNDEISFTYTNYPANLPLYLYYGFYIRNNIFNDINARVNDKTELDSEQIKLCKNLNCGEINKPFKDFKLRSTSVCQELIHLGRVSNLEKGFDYKNVFKQLINNKRISLENELNAWLYYRSMVYLSYSVSKIKIEQSIKFAQDSVDVTRSLEAKWLNNDPSYIREWTRFKHFENIYKVDVSYKIIVIEHLLLSTNHIISNVNEEIQILKQKYLTN